MAKTEEKSTNFSNPTRFVFGNKHYTILSVVTYPRELYPGFLSNINSVQGVKVSIKHVPVSLETLRNQVSEEINDLRSAINNDKNTIAQAQYREDIEALTDYFNDLNEFQPRVFDFKMHLIVSAENEEQLDERIGMVHTKLEGMDMKAIPLMFVQDEVLKSCLPIFPPQNIENKIGSLIPSFNIAGMYPFVFDCLKDAGSGTILGTDVSGGIILFNQYLYLEEQEPSRNNANAIIIGNKSSGKTAIARLLLRTSIRNGNTCYFIDPDGTLTEFVAGIGGDYIQFGKGSHIINPLEVVVDTDSEEVAQGLGYTAFSRTINHVKAFMVYLSPSLPLDAVMVLERVLLETYARFNINANTNFKTLNATSYPTLDDLYATVRGKLVTMNEASAERTALDTLEKLLKPFTAELRGYFNGHTSINTYTDFVVFNYMLINNENLRNALMFNTIRYCYGKSIASEKVKSIFIDKFDYLITNLNPYALSLYAQIQRKTAKFKTGLTIIYEPNRMLEEQNLANDWKVLFDNAAYYLITGLKKTTLDYLSKYIEFNDTEKENVRYFQPGEALLVCGRRRMNINITLTPDELSEFNM